MTRRFAQDFLHARRSLWRDRGMVAAAVVCLALGIGTQTVALDLVDGLLLRGPAGVREPAEVRRLFLSTRKEGTESSLYFSYPVFAAVRESGAFAQVATYFNTALTYQRGDAAYKNTASFVSGEFFPLLGVAPVVGRSFTVEEAAVETPAAVLLLHHGLAERLFGSAAAALGQSLRFGEQPYEVVGVLPPGFEGIDLERSEMYFPLGAAQNISFSPGWHENPNVWTLQTLARLDTEVASAAAERALAAAAPFHDDAFEVTLAPIQASRVPGSSTGKLLVGLSVVAAVVLLIACLNVASLFLVRHLRRRQELGVRVALGAGRSDLVRLLAAESLWVAGLAGLLALGVAAVESELLRGLFLPDASAVASTPLPRILAITAALVLVVAVLCALLPALRLKRREVAPLLRTTGRSLDPGHGRLEGALLVVQVTLATVCVVAVGWFLASLAEIESLDLGLEPDEVWVASLDTSGVPPGAATEELYRQALARLDELPGVEDGALAIGIPFASSYGVGVSLPTGEPPKLPTGGPYMNGVSESFFTTLGTDVLRGRGFAVDDLKPGAAPVVVVNQTMADLFWPGGDALGECLGIGEQPCVRVVGVVEDARRSQLQEEPTFQLYVPLTQAPDWMSSRALFARSQEDPKHMAAAIQRALEPLVPGRWVEVARLDGRLERHLRPFELGTSLLGLTAGLALVLIVLGIYAATARAVTERRHELGVRLALGAERHELVGLQLRRVIGWLLPGLLLGGVAAILLGRLAEPLLFEVSPRDPRVLGGAAAVLALVSLVATWLPARRASKVSPTAAFRVE